MVEPEEVKLALVAAQHRAGRRLLLWVVLALIFATVITASSAAGFVLTYRTAARNQALARQLVALQSQQINNAATGRAILSQLLSFSDPTSPTVKEQQAKTAAYLAMLDQAQRLGRADQLKKLGQIAEALGAPKATVDRILAQPVPVPTFAP